MTSERLTSEAILKEKLLNSKGTFSIQQKDLSDNNLKKSMFPTVSQ